MFCKRCGANLAPNTSVCPNCNMPLMQPANNQNPQLQPVSQTPPTVKKSNTVAIVAIISFAVVAIVVAVLFFLKNNDKSSIESGTSIDEGSTINQGSSIDAGKPTEKTTTAKTPETHKLTLNIELCRAPIADYSMEIYIVANGKLNSVATVTPKKLSRVNRTVEVAIQDGNYEFLVKAVNKKGVELETHDEFQINGKDVTINYLINTESKEIKLTRQ